MELMKVDELNHFGTEGDLRYLLITKLNYPSYIIYDGINWYNQLINYLRICGWSRKVPTLYECLSSLRRSKAWHCKHHNLVLQVQEATVYGESNTGKVACQIYRVYDGHRQFYVF